jgi:two-component system, cell cycle response regulator
VGALSSLAWQVAERLPGAGFTHVSVPDWKAAQRELLEWLPAAILLAPAREGEPYAALNWIRSLDRLAFVPVVVFGSPGEELQIGEGIAAGADEVVAGNRSDADVLACVVARIARARRLEQLALRDPLTGLHNRRFMNERLPAEIARAVRAGSELALAIIDLDEFKRVNDQLGHTSGDGALAAFASVLGGGLRSYDLVCRFGGDEFVVLFPGCSAEGAKAALSKFSSRRGWTLPDCPSLTFSAGIAGFPGDGQLLGDLFEAADKRLQFAKRLGRDQVVVAG